jgi:serine/threonine-protein kinase RsbW
MEKSEQNQTLILTNCIGELGTIRASLKQIIVEWGIPASMEFSLNLVLEEAFTNVVNYAFDNGKEHQIELCFEILKRNLIITITDEGMPYDPTLIPEPDTKLDADKRPLGGLGFFLVRKYMDKVEYCRNQNKNQLILTKNLAL